MNEQNDWRIMNQVAYLYHKKLKQIPYIPYNKHWTHDHCSFCREIIDTSTKDAYCTLDEYHWICQNCFEDFREMFQWEL